MGLYGGELKPVKDKDQVPTTVRSITDENIQFYANAVLRGEGEVEDIFKQSFGFMPTPQEILEIEAHPIYRSAIESITATLQARLRTNGVVLADAALLDAYKSLRVNRDLIDQMITNAKNEVMVMNIRDYVSLQRVQIEIWKVVKDELFKAQVAMAKGEDEDTAVWEEIYQEGEL